MTETKDRPNQGPVEDKFKLHFAHICRGIPATTQRLVFVKRLKRCLWGTASVRGFIPRKQGKRHAAWSCSSFGSMLRDGVDNTGPHSLLVTRLNLSFWWGFRSLLQRAVALECDNSNDNYNTLRIERRRCQLNESFVRKDGNTFSKGALYSKLSCSRITVAVRSHSSWVSVYLGRW